MKKTVLVTGSSKGIGKEIAFIFGKKGYSIVLNGSKDKKALETTKKEFLQQHSDLDTVMKLIR